MKKEDNFWDKAKLDKDRVNRLFEEVAEVRKNSTCPFKTLNNLVKSLDDFNLREIAYVSLFLDYLAELYSKKLLIIADTLNCDNKVVLESILSFTSMFEDYFNPYKEESNDGM